MLWGRSNSSALESKSRVMPTLPSCSGARAGDPPAEAAVGKRHHQLGSEEGSKTGSRDWVKAWCCFRVIFCSGWGAERTPCSAWWSGSWQSLLEQKALKKAISHKGKACMNMILWGKGEDFYLLLFFLAWKCWRSILKLC